MRCCSLLDNAHTLSQFRSTTSHHLAACCGPGLGSLRQVSNLRLAYQRLLKRSAIAAVSVKPWVQRLQALTAASAAGVGTLQQLSRLHTQVGGGGRAASALLCELRCQRVRAPHQY